MGHADAVPASLDRLTALAALAAEAGAEALAAEAKASAERLAEGRFHVTCVGQFKRGKSTLLNALVGDPVLPMGVTPVTTVITVLRHGACASARVHFADGRIESVSVSAIRAFVSEADNPRNAKQVAAVDVCLPSPLLASGMCLVDTPGIGSVFEASTRATETFVPQIDAALVVLGADPPISGEEIRLLETVAEQIEDLIFVLNKADKLSDAELAEAVHFTRGVIAERLDRHAADLFEVSALERLQRGRDSRDWRRLDTALHALAERSGGRIVEEAGRRTLTRLTGQLLQDLEERQQALRRPIAESEARLADLRRWSADADHALKDLAPLFVSVQNDLSRQLEDRRERFLSATRLGAIRALDAELGVASGLLVRVVRARAARAARDIARRHVLEWLTHLEPEAEALYREATGRLVHIANDFVARLAAAARLPAGALAELGPSVTRFRLPRHFYFHDLLTLTTPGFLRRLSDAVAPRRPAVERIRRQAVGYLDRLLETNSSRVTGDLRDRFVESGRQLQAEIRARLKVTVDSAEHALSLARTQQAAGETAVRAELAKLDDLARRAARLAADR